MANQWPPEKLELSGLGVGRLSRHNFRVFRDFFGMLDITVKPVFPAPPNALGTLFPDYIDSSSGDEPYILGATFRSAGSEAGFAVNFVSASFNRLVDHAEQLRNKPKTTKLARASTKQTAQLSLLEGLGVDQLKIILPGERSDANISADEKMLSLRGLCAAVKDHSIQNIYGMKERSEELGLTIVRRFISVDI